MQGIDDIYLGRWTHPRTGVRSPRSPVQRIEIADSLDGAEAELARIEGAAGRIDLVADSATWEALGRRVRKSLEADGGNVRELVLPADVHASLREAAALAQRLEGAERIVAVGSGTLNDLVKCVAARINRPYVVFGTAPSMDGFASSTVSMTLESGLKQSMPARPPLGVFLDIQVLAAAPARMAAAGFGDCICSSAARTDWWMSHRLLGTAFHEEPYAIAAADSKSLMAHAPGIRRRDPTSIGYLARSLILSGLGVGFTGVSHHGSMGEHQISHYIDCFAAARHPGTLHGEQVGVATLTMGRIQERLLSMDRPPTQQPTRIDETDMVRRMGTDMATQCLAEYRRKAADDAEASRRNRRLRETWPELRRECSAWREPVEELRSALAAAGGATSAAELGLDPAFYREAVRHAHEMRNRFSFADLACDAGLLDSMADEEA